MPGWPTQGPCVWQGGSSTGAPSTAAVGRCRGRQDDRCGGAGPGSQVGRQVHDKGAQGGGGGRGRGQGAEEGRDAGVIPSSKHEHQHRGGLSACSSPQSTNAYRAVLHLGQCRTRVAGVHRKPAPYHPDGGPRVSTTGDDRGCGGRAPRGRWGCCLLPRIPMCTQWGVSHGTHTQGQVPSWGARACG